VLVVVISLNAFSSLMAFEHFQTMALGFSGALFISSFLVWADMYAMAKKIDSVSFMLASLAVISFSVFRSYISLDIPSEQILYLALLLLIAAATCLWKIATMHFAVIEYESAVPSFGWEIQGRTSKRNEGNWNASFYIINNVKHLYQTYLTFWNHIFSVFSINKNLSRQLFKSTHEMYALLPLMILLMLFFTEFDSDILFSMLPIWVWTISSSIGRDFTLKKELMDYWWLFARGVSRRQYNLKLAWMLISHYFFVYFLAVAFLILGSVRSPNTLFFGVNFLEFAMALGTAGVFQVCLTLDGAMRIKLELDFRVTFLFYYFIFLAVLGISMFLISMSTFWLPIMIVLGCGCVFYSLNRWQAHELQME
jgi:hypothetical protein